MSITVKVPASLSHLTGGKKTVECTGDNIAACLTSLEAQFPGIKDKLCNEKGDAFGFINVFVNGENVRYLQGMDTPLQEGDELTIIPAIAGG
ncbi:MAG: MoaD/ThiS family protein [Peptococcaceae bacterium]|jgi:molybdopterin synthase sulfur carrier subunit|nr:MAG: MoaD/ThiS family protein [Peptococcaceae bacterium]